MKWMTLLVLSASCYRAPFSASSGTTGDGSSASGDETGNSGLTSDGSTATSSDSTTDADDDDAGTTGDGESSDDDTGGDDDDDTSTDDDDEPLGQCIATADDELEAVADKCVALERLCQRLACEASYRASRANRHHACYSEHAPDELEQLNELEQLESDELDRAQCLRYRDIEADAMGRDCYQAEADTCD